jgi:uncharacterized protein
LSAGRYDVIERDEMSDLAERVKVAIDRRINDSTQSIVHRADHLDRVKENARGIAATLVGVDQELLDLAVLLHDVDQPVGRKGEHVALSMKAAKEILDEVGCAKDRAALVLQIISEHSSEHIDTLKPTSIEAKILFDADKLDGLGAIGISRVFSLFGQMNGSIEDAIPWYRRKIDLSLTHLQTEEGRRLCHARLPFVLQFLGQLELELVSQMHVRSHRQPHRDHEPRQSAPETHGSSLDISRLPPRD